MRSHKALSLLLPAVVLACSGPEPSPTESRPAFAATCNTPTVSANPKSVTQPPQSTRQATFTVSVTCAGANGTWELFATRTGAVSTIVTLSAGTVTLTAGQSATVTVTYITGSPGTGTVVLEAFMDAPLRKSSGTHIVTVTGSTPTGIPYGPTGWTPDTLTSTSIWTGDHLSGANRNASLKMLAAARGKSVRIWFNFIGIDTIFMNPDSSFNLQEWKDSLDRRWGPIKSGGTSFYYDSLLTYIQDGTLQGNQLLDDVAQFKPDPTFAQYEAMAAHSKLRFPALPTAIRATAAVLKAASGGARYAKLDAAWAQYRPTRGAVIPYRDGEIADAKAVGLGLVLGMNIRKGMAGNGPMPTDSILAWGKELLKAGASDYACGFYMWDDGYHSLTNSVFVTLANLAKNHVASSCKQRP